MELKIRKLYEYVDGSGVGGSAGSGPKDIDYAKMEESLTKLGACITNILTALEKNINVTSYQGSAQADVELAVNKIRPYLASMKEPLGKMREKIEEVKTTYAAREASVKSALGGIGGGEGNTSTTHSHFNTIARG